MGVEYGKHLGGVWLNYLIGRRCMIIRRILQNLVCVFYWTVLLAGDGTHGFGHSALEVCSLELLHKLGSPVRCGKIRPLWRCFNYFSEE
jgi:hypothetical protein